MDAPPDDGSLDPHFQGARPLQTEVKHRILEGYLWIWIRHLHRHHELAFIDACAGPGRFEHDGSPGSPVIAARFNDEQEIQDKEVRLSVHACESKPAHFAALRKALQAWIDRFPPCAFTYPVKFGEVLEAILAQTRGRPTLLFVDTYGMTGIEPAQLAPVLSDADRRYTEILVRVAPEMFGRWAGWIDRADEDSQWGRHARTMLKKLEGLGINIDALKNDQGAKDSAGLFYEYLKLFYRRFRYVQPLPVRPSHSYEPKYYLVHGTDSHHGAAYINDVCASAEDWLYERFEQEKAGDQMNLFALPTKRRVYAQDLEPTIQEILAEGQRSWIEVRAMLAVAHGSKFNARSHRAAAKRLRDQGLISWNPLGAIEDSSVCRLSISRGAGAS